MINKKKIRQEEKKTMEGEQFEKITVTFNSEHYDRLYRTISMHFCQAYEYQSRVLCAQSDKRGLVLKSDFLQNSVLVEMLSKKQTLWMCKIYLTIKLTVGMVNQTLIDLERELDFVVGIKSFMSTEDHVKFLRVRKEYCDAFHFINYSVKSFLHILSVHCPRNVYNPDVLNDLDFSYSMDYFIEKDMEICNEIDRYKRKKRRTVDQINKDELMYDNEIASMILYSKDTLNLRSRSVKKIKC